MTYINVGNSAIDRNGAMTYGKTYIDYNNPANANGTIVSVEIYAEQTLYDCVVAIFHRTGTFTFTTRDHEAIGTVIQGAKRTFSVNLTIEAGDYIGLYYSSGLLEASSYGGNGHWYQAGLRIPCTNETFTCDCGYRIISIWGRGEYPPPTVTTQAVTDILSTTATGNGNITDIGIANPTKRGVCWNTTGSPTIDDNIAEEDGNFGVGAFTADITGLSLGETYYVRAYAINWAGISYGAEVDFTAETTPPTVSTQVPTSVLPTTATANGDITATGGVNATVRGFKYGLSKENTWDVHDNGDYEVGVYTKGLTGLSANTTYWIRAYATNSQGTSYGDWVEFQTAASGTIPTGTDLFICADLSGYTYQLMRSETDDGETYTAYFVISTDLTNKQGLSFYKRILDLHLYLRSEASGTLTVEVKGDNEAEWRGVGTVTLAGTEDIIVKHLAPDIRAKVFLFKITASNFFRFLGCLFEYLPEEMR